MDYTGRICSAVVHFSKIIVFTKALVALMLGYRGRGSQRAGEKATFPCPRTPTPSGFLVEFTLIVEIFGFSVSFIRGGPFDVNAK